MACSVPFIITALVSTAVSVAVSMAMRQDTDPNDVGSNVTKAGVQSPRNRVFGKSRVSCTNVYSNVLDSRNDIRLDVFTIAGIGKLKYIHNTWIDDKPVFTSNKNIVTDPAKENDGLFSGIDLTPTFQKQDVEIQFRSGSDRERALELAIDNSDGDWTTKSRGDRVPQVAVKATRVIDDEGVVILGSEYKIYAEVTGGDVYDPRTDTYTSSRNPALALLEVLTDDYYGMAIPLSYINVESFKAAATWTETSKLYIDGEINCNQSFNDIITNVISCFGGALVIENGLLTVLYDDVSAVVDSLNEDNYIKGSFEITEASSSNYYNTVTINYKSFVNEQKEDKYQLPANIYTDPTIQADGKVTNKTLSMPLSIDGRISNADGALIDGPVKFMANRIYRKAKYQKQCKVAIDLIQHPAIKINSVVEISNVTHQWDKEKFRVSNIQNRIDGEELSIAIVTFDEYNEYVYTGNEDGAGGGIPPPKLPDTILAPTNLNFEQKTFTESGYGILTWDALHYSPENKFQVDYKLTSSAAWTRRGEVQKKELAFSNLKKDSYDFRVRLVDRLIGTSDWSPVLTKQITSDVVINAVTGVLVNAIPSDFVITWDDMTKDETGGTGDDPDSGGDGGTLGDRFAYYRVDIKHGDTGASVIASYFPTENSFIYSFEENKKNGLSRTVTAEVYSVTKSGEISPKAASSVDTGINAVHAAPTGVDISGAIGSAWIKFALSNESDFMGTEVHMSTSADFVPGPTTLEATLGSETLYIWNFPPGSDDTSFRYVRLGHFDKFGQDNINYSPAKLVQFAQIDNPLFPFDPDEIIKKIDDNKILIDKNKGDIAGNVAKIADNDRVIKEIGDDVGKFIPDISDSLGALRDANNAPTGSSGQPISERINLVASPNKGHTAGYGLYSTDAGVSRMIIAADELIVGGGKGAGASNSSVGFSYDSAQQKLFLNNATVVNLTSVNIKAGSILATDIKAGDITSTQIKAGSILATDIKAGEITANEIAGGTITGIKIKADEITGNHIQVGSVHANRIESETITANQIKAGAITAIKIATDAIESNKIKAGAITAGKIDADAVTGDKISSATTITAGSGDSVAVMSGSNASYRFWAGNASPASAPFSISNTGKTVIKSNATGSRLVMDGDRLEVWDGTTLKVRIGRLT